MRLSDYLNLARERWLVIVGVVLATVAAVVALTLAQTPLAEATVRLRARPAAPGSELSPILAEQQTQDLLGTEAELVRSTPVATAVAERIGYRGQPNDLLDDIEVVRIPETTVLFLRSTAREADDAIELANAFAEEYIAFRRETVSKAVAEETQKETERLDRTLTRLGEVNAALANLPPGSVEATAAESERNELLADLVVIRSRLDALNDRAPLEAGFAEVIEPATDASTVRSTSAERGAVFGLLIGLPLALAAVLLLDSLTNTVKSRSHAQRYSGADVIGIIPFDKGWTEEGAARLVNEVEPFSPPAEAYRALAFALGASIADLGAATIVVTGPGDGDGKTATVANLALALADSGVPCVAVGADLRNPRLHAFFRSAQEPGLTDALAGEVEVEEAVQTLGDGLTLLPSGRTSPRPDLLLARGDIGGAIERLRGGRAPGARPLRSRPAGDSKLVLIDSASIVSAAETSRLVALADATILVARANVTSRQALATASEQVRRTGGHLLGVVLVGVRSVVDPATAPLELGPIGDYETSARSRERTAVAP